MEALRERFGKYHVLEKIAQGGMAEVYKVKTIGIAGFEKVQALKRILPSSAREARFIRSFIDEARIAVELTHRNIVQVFDFGKADGELFMAMELIEGRDLRAAMMQAVSRDVPCPIPVAAYVISEVASGLDYAHRKTDGYGGALGIVHCDVSPSNVMLSTDGYVKILDFGIARATFSSALERRRLRGKPRYMAPEQTLGEPATAAADVFALGIIAWELFTGLPLFRGNDIKSILEAVRRTDPKRVDALNPEVPKEIADAIATALSKEPSARGTTADLAQACMRTAMTSGARHVAAWLKELDAHAADSVSVSWQALPAQTPPRPSTMSGPPLRQSTRSMTSSIVNVPPAPPDFGQGTPHSIDVALPPPPRERTASVIIEQVQRFSTEYEREVTASVTAAKPFGPITNVITSVGLPAFLTDATTTSSSPPPKWDARERTAEGVGKLQDIIDAYEAPREPRMPTETAVAAIPTAQYERLSPAAAAMRFDDDDATQFGFTAPSPEAFAVEELEVEDDVVSAVDQPAIDEPIDDDLGVLPTGMLAERRRAVVVAALLDGGDGDMLRPIAKSLGELAYQRGGVVLALDDASLVLAFGLEVAGEDDVAIAMGWALDAAAMARDAGGSLRIGARTGVASAQDSGVAKDAIDEARAIAKDASPDRPMFMGAAGRVTSGLYELREVRSRIGRRSRAVMEVVAPRGFGERDQARLERRGLFVGRTQQLAELEVWFQRAIAADRRLTALVQGPAGTGKSRLVAEFVAKRGNQPMRVIMTGATPASQLAPFALVIDLYQAALGMPPTRGRAARAQTVQRLLHLMKEAGTPDERARAVATDLDRAMELRDGVGVSPEVADLRPRISAGLAAFRAAMVDRNRPLLTIIEDIHLSDGASLEVLRHTLGVTALGPELLLLTARPEGATPPAVDVVIGVADLTGQEQKALITDRLGEAATPLNVATVMQRGGGNPLFIEELAQAAREAGAEVPASARDVVAARVARLSQTAKTALHFAALLGGSIRARLLEELLGAESLETEVDELVEAGFLVPAGEGELTFVRGLDREVIYESMSARALRENHARVGRLFASRFFAGREEPPAVIAEHMERGGEIAGAAAFWLRAGKLALTASDAQSAVAHFTRTLTLERELGATPPTSTSRARRREALVGREEANRMLGDVVSHPHDLDELQKLCEGDPRRLADVSIRRAHRLLRLGDYAGATVATVVAEDFAMTAEDQRQRGEALRVRSEVLERLGRFDEALLVVDDARELFAREGAVADEMAAMVGRGRIHLMRAHYEAARDAYRPVIQRIEKTGDPWLERIVQNHVAIIEMCLGNFSLAMASAERSLELCRRYGDRSREGDALSVAGIILLEVGLYDQAAARFAEALDLLSRTASRWGRADSLIYAGLCEVHRGRPAEGLMMLDEALAESRRLGARYLEANALISRAGAQIRIGNFPSAIADAAAGTAVAQSATLVGYEIQGLARQAFATLLTRDATRLGEAGNLAHRALVLIEQQRYLEGSEEEVYANCYSVLMSAGAIDRANAVKAQGRYEVERKLAGLSDPAWRMAYSAIRENRLLLS